MGEYHDRHFVERANGVIDSLIKSMTPGTFRAIHESDYEWIKRQLDQFKSGDMPPERAQFMIDTFGVNWCEPEYKYMYNIHGKYVQSLIDSGNPEYIGLLDILRLTGNYEHAFVLNHMNIRTLEQLARVPFNILTCNLSLSLAFGYGKQLPPELAWLKNLARILEVAKFSGPEEYILNEAISYSQLALNQKMNPNYEYVDGFIYWMFGNTQATRLIYLEDIPKYLTTSCYYFDTESSQLRQVIDLDTMIGLVNRHTAPYMRGIKLSNLKDEAKSMCANEVYKFITCLSKLKDYTYHNARGETRYNQLNELLKSGKKEMQKHIDSGGKSLDFMDNKIELVIEDAVKSSINNNIKPVKLNGSNVPKRQPVTKPTEPGIRGIFGLFKRR